MSKRKVVPSESDLTDAIEDAARKAIRSLFQKHPEEFYYCSLITDGMANAPILSASSVESLQRTALLGEDPEAALPGLKWSYADSPYFAYGEEHFGHVRKLFLNRPAFRPEMSEDEWNHEFETRLRAMETAMSRLDGEGLFGEGDGRSRIVINVEVMPPDHTNTERALRLNPKRALVEWLVEIAEEP